MNCYTSPAHKRKVLGQNFKHDPDEPASEASSQDYYPILPLRDISGPARRSLNFFIQRLNAETLKIHLGISFRLMLYTSITHLVCKRLKLEEKKIRNSRSLS